MQKACFIKAQIIKILKEADSRVLAKDVCRKHEISEASRLNLKPKYGGMDASDLKLIKEMDAVSSTCMPILHFRPCAERP